MTGKINDEQLVRACRSFFGESWNLAEVEAMRDALNAAFSDLLPLPTSSKTAEQPLCGVLDADEEALIANLQAEYGRSGGTYHSLLIIISKLRRELADQAREYEYKLRIAELETRAARAERGSP